MATEKAKATKTKASTAKPKAAQAKATPAPSRVEHARSVAETALDVPVGVVLEVSDRVTDVVGPFTDRSAAQRQLKSYRTQLRRSVKRSERRGATARRKATTEARRTRTRVEREARKRQREVQTTLKRNRSEVEQRVRKAFEAPASRAQNLVDQVSEQIAALR